MDCPDRDRRVRWLFDGACDPSAIPLTPTELGERIGDALIRAGLGAVTVTGAVAGVRRGRSWWDVELVDPPTSALDSGRPAVVRVVGFDRTLGLPAVVDDGATVEVTGAATWDADRSAVRVIAEDLQLVGDAAEAQYRRQRVLDALADEGLLTAQRTLRVPARPLRIAVITGVDSAGAADLRAVLDGSGLEWQLREDPVPMSGPRTAGAVVDALGALGGAGPDVIVVARGGGGRAALSTWDDPSIARSVASCPVPVWTAIGHATYSTLVDLVANRSFPAPAAAAGALVERVRTSERHRHEQAMLRAHAVRVAQLEARARHLRILAAVLTVVVVLVAIGAAVA